MIGSAKKPGASMRPWAIASESHISQTGWQKSATNHPRRIRNAFHASMSAAREAE